MKFCIATIAYWQSVGFDTSNWRTSINGTKAMCHDKFARTLVDLDGNPEVETYDIDSPAFARVIEGEFMEEVEE
ncbi:hypothetical protein [Planomicrobium sp. YIM 101495]|uniref:hypothetical protein n=1 Tax=Planomicrobium sp. YIM 101495 TaxID=2665160 RepID=UPI0012B77BEF|nr:hypothetical protein [Planomicrobium sp. YIM 101495]MTD30149.1 hypothetical protein [Planomicrobium sp. YIM 101495]